MLGLEQSHCGKPISTPPGILPHHHITTSWNPTTSPNFLSGCLTGTTIYHIFTTGSTITHVGDVLEVPYELKCHMNTWNGRGSCEDLLQWDSCSQPWLRYHWYMPEMQNVSKCNTKQMAKFIVEGPNTTIVTTCHFRWRKPNFSSSHLMNACYVSVKFIMFLIILALLSLFNHSFNSLLLCNYCQFHMTTEWPNGHLHNYWLMIICNGLLQPGLDSRLVISQSNWARIAPCVPLPLPSIVIVIVIVIVSLSKTFRSRVVCGVYCTSYLSDSTNHRTLISHFSPMDCLAFRCVLELLNVSYWTCHIERLVA